MSERERGRTSCNQMVRCYTAMSAYQYTGVAKLDRGRAYKK
jgi:hypothetical protein